MGPVEEMTVPARIRGATEGMYEAGYSPDDFWQETHAYSANKGAAKGCQMSNYWPREWPMSGFPSSHTSNSHSQQISPC